MASGRYVARELTDGGKKEGGEHGDPVLGLTGARVAVEKEFSGGSAQARREGVGAVRTGGGSLLL
jgi:hypothetical protein